MHAALTSLSRLVSSATSAIARDYDVGPSIGSAGLWELHSGVRRATQQSAPPASSSTPSPAASPAPSAPSASSAAQASGARSAAVSILVFDKQRYFTQHRLTHKTDQERVLGLLRKEASALTRLRHPAMLEVVEPLEETRASLTLVVEASLGSLGDMMRLEQRRRDQRQHRSSSRSGSHSNSSSSNNNDNSNSNSSDDDDAFQLDALEIQKGLLQLARGLQFLHDTARLVHGNLDPSAIVINARGDWKIAGLGFSTHVDGSPQSAGTSSSSSSSSNANNNANGSLSMQGLHDYDPHMPAECQQNLEYLAPERAGGGTATNRSDVFALGCLAYAVHHRYGYSPLGRIHGDSHRYRSAVEDNRIARLLAGSSAASLDEDAAEMSQPLRQLVAAMVDADAARRPSLGEVAAHGFFDNVLVATIRYLEALVEKADDAKAKFLGGLARVIPQLPGRTQRRKLLPLLLDTLRDPALVPFALPNIFLIAEAMAPRDFQASVLRPAVVDVVASIRSQLAAASPAAQPSSAAPTLQLLLDRLELMRAKTTAAVFRDECMAVVQCALEAGDMPAVVDKALRVVPAVAESLDYAYVKGTLFPRILAVYSRAAVLSVKIGSLVCFHAMLPILDRLTVSEKLLPLLRRTRTREPGVMMAMLAVYEELGRKHLDREAVACEILPELWRLSIDPQLALAQFQKYMQAIKALSRQIEEQQTKHLEGLQRMASSTAATSVSASALAVADNPFGADSPFGTDGAHAMPDFEQLVLSSSAARSQPSSGAGSTRHSSASKGMQPTSRSRTSASPHPAATAAATAAAAADLFDSLDAYATPAAASSTLFTASAIPVLKPSAPASSVKQTVPSSAAATVSSSAAASAGRMAARHSPSSLFDSEWDSFDAQPPPSEKQPARPAPPSVSKPLLPASTPLSSASKPALSPASKPPPGFGMSLLPAASSAAASSSSATSRRLNSASLKHFDPLG